MGETKAGIDYDHAFWKRQRLVLEELAEWYHRSS